MSLRSGLAGARQKLLCSLHRRNVAFENRGPIVSFTFDDFPRSAASAGAVVLEHLGVRGTYYAAMGLMNTSNELGEQFRSEDLASLHGKGHELASHTFGHLSCRSVPLTAFRNDVEKGRKAIASACGEDTGNFAYPFGHISLRAKRTLGPLLASSRSVIPGLNGPEIDLNLLRANRLYGDLSASRGVEDLISQNLEQGTWLIFYTHDVCPHPSPYGCTPALLEFAVSAARRSGSRILTVQDAVAEVKLGTARAEVEEVEPSVLTAAG
jgi:peptidoglycan/xylan/chitin deacetylase (PgdA/CDA1 family)